MFIRKFFGFIRVDYRFRQEPSSGLIMADMNEYRVSSDSTFFGFLKRSVGTETKVGGVHKCLE